LVALNKRKVPARAILAGTVFAYGAIFASIQSPTGVFVFLNNSSGTAMLFLYLMIAAAQIRGRNRMSPQAQANLPLKMWLFPGLSYLTELGIVGVLAAMAFIPDLKSQLYTTLALTMGLIAVYVVFRRGRAMIAQASQA
jgi:L-asparagine transporter-like permease